MTSLFRPAPQRSSRANLLWTAGQCTGVWGLALVLGPALLVAVDRWAGLPGFHFPGQPVVALLLLVATSALNVASGAVLAVRGHGTPLPLACPREFVVAGPYRYVRNPMAVAGIGQGVAIALGLGSWLVLAYALAGGAVWHFAIRPVEERDLTARFGREYVEYQGAVPLWMPRARPYVTFSPPARS